MIKLTLTGKDIIALVLIIFLGLFIVTGHNHALTTIFISAFTLYVLGEKIHTAVKVRRGK
jgi:hypothetical protein